MTGKKTETGCIFCNRLDCDDEEHFVVHRGEYWYVIMNRYPYNSGHLLLVLGRHEAALSNCTPHELDEMGRLLRVMEAALLEALQPQGINCGYNGGESAGAGIPEHLHIHMLPRWAGDTNFISTVGETRVMPQTLEQSYETIRPVFRRLLGEG